ncbi:MAG: cation:proton antiporter [Phycisphaerales bacterium]|nr:cation:proton antiporter [Phycisphaerales bacterium]
MSNNTGTTIALALGVSALVTVASRRVGMPALLPLLLTGLALGTSGLGVVDASSLGNALTGFITVAIGLLIFEGALHLNKEELGHAPRAVWGLLTVGAAITWIGAAAAAHFILGMSLPVAALLGAVLIVTGPTVVQPILKLVRLSPRLQAVLSAEAVLIDPIGVVATVATLEVVRLYVLSGFQPGLAGQGLLLFAKPLLGGAGVGLVMGLAGYWLLRLFGRSKGGNAQTLNLVAIGVCMTCVGLGELVAAEAGLAAVTICGVLMARAKVLGATELRSFKELLAVILVGTLFILLASRFDVALLGTLGWREGVFVLVLLLAVRPISVWASTGNSKLSAREKAFAATFAPRGIVALSVVAVTAAELKHLFSTPGAPHVAADVGGMLRDAERLELIVFAVIAGTVLMASTFSPFAAWALRVKAAKGTSVLLLGGHPLSVSLAQLLSESGMEVRVIDSNEAVVASATGAGVDALAGDATDSRWLDDVGSPRGVGWVIAWTGNHDVDQVVVRWAQQRLGPGHAALWSNKPARAEFAAADIGAGDSIVDWVDSLSRGRVSVIQSTDPAKLSRVVCTFRDGRLSLRLPGAEEQPADGNTLFIGLSREAAAIRSAAGGPVSTAAGTHRQVPTGPVEPSEPTEERTGEQ